MNTTDITQHKDPLIDAYRQASVHDGARAGANARAAVLAHARVVAQSLPSSAANAATLSDATRDAAAANEARPLWRMAAGVVIGLVGVWIFQLTRPANAPDTTVAAASAPQADKARVAESAAAAAPAAAQPEATVAVATPAPAAPSVTADASVSRARSDGGSSPKPVESPPADASVAIASAASPAPFVGNTAATQSTAAAADTANSEPFRETVVASAELRKSTKVGGSPLIDQPAMAAATPRTPSAAPNAFPAQTAEPMIAAAPALAAVPGSAPPPASAAPSIAMGTVVAPSAGGASGALAARAASTQSDTMKVLPQAAAKPAKAARAQMRLSEVDQAMFRAVRAGDLSALRASIARGANVSATDERGRTTLQIARERDDAAIVETLQTAGAR